MMGTRGDGRCAAARRRGGGGGGDLSQLPYYLLNTTDNYHLEDLATLSHLPTPLDCISLRTLNLRLN